jgi:hypothetical protein
MVLGQMGHKVESKEKKYALHLPRGPEPPPALQPPNTLPTRPPNPLAWQEGQAAGSRPRLT